VFEKALEDEEMEEDTEAGDEESASEPEDEEQVGKLSEHSFIARQTTGNVSAGYSG